MKTDSTTHSWRGGKERERERERERVQRESRDASRGKHLRQAHSSPRADPGAVGDAGSRGEKQQTTTETHTQQHNI